MSERRSKSLAEYAAEADGGRARCPVCHWERCVQLFKRGDKAKYQCRQCGGRFWRELPKDKDGDQ